jgi:hypothetical protein
MFTVRATSPFYVTFVDFIILTVLAGSANYRLNCVLF